MLGTLFDIYIVIHDYITLVDQNTSLFTYLCNAKVYEFCICKVSATLQVWLVITRASKVTYWLRIILYQCYCWQYLLSDAFVGCYSQEEKEEEHGEEMVSGSIYTHYTLLLGYVCKHFLQWDYQVYGVKAHQSTFSTIRRVCIDYCESGHIPAFFLPPQFE